MKKLFTLCATVATFMAYSQNLVNDGGTINIAVNDTISVPGQFTALDTAIVNNNGVLQVAGNFTGTGNSQHLGTGIYRFNGMSPQTLSLDNTITSIELDNDSNLFLASNISGVTALNFVDGQIISNGNNLTMSVIANSISGADSNKYFVCNNNGQLRYINVGSASQAFYPVGADTISYNPVWLSNTGTPDNIGVYVFNNILLQGTTGSANTFDQHLVNRTWVLTEDVVGSTRPNITLQWETAHQRSLFNLTGDLGISNFNTFTSQWNYMQEALSVNGTGPYTVTQNYSTPLVNLGAFIIADANSQLLFVGLDENAVDMVITYPNPATAGNTLQLTAPNLANRNVILQLYNSAGQLVFSEKNTVSAQGNYNTTMPAVSSGLYLLTLSDGVNALYKSKLVVR